MRKTATVAWLAALAVTMAPLSGCVKPEPYRAAGADAGAAETTPANQRPGTVIAATPFDDVDNAVKSVRATAKKVRYRSTGADGAPTEVTGTVFVPPGAPPPGGWPVVALAHDTTGIGAECAPSRYPDLYGSAGQVASLLGINFAVAVTDYQGLGADGVHPYLDAKTAAYNVIDSVRAMRAEFPSVSNQWAALGTGQGGGAAWAAAEVAASYAPDIHLVGSTSLDPMADMTGLAQAAADRRLTNEQAQTYILLLMGLQGNERGFDVDDYRRGVAAQTWDGMRGCTPAAARKRNEVIGGLDPADLVPSSPEATQRLTDTLAKMAVPQRRNSAPMLVIYGGADKVTPPEWTAGAIAKACGMGSKIATIFQPDRGSANLDVGEFPGWLLARMNGLPAPVTC